MDRGELPAEHYLTRVQYVILSEHDFSVFLKIHTLAVMVFGSFEDCSPSLFIPKSRRSPLELLLSVLNRGPLL